MQGKISSDDLELIRLIAESGTLAGAARRLGINHATAFRRLNRIEQRLRTRLFDRGRSGYRPTAAGDLAVEHARRIAGQLSDFETRVVGCDLAPSGTVRLATTDTLLAGLLGPLLVKFRQTFPLIDLEVATSNRVADLSRREADLALRPSRQPPEFLLGRRIGRIELAIYAGREVAVDGDPLDPGGEPAWIGPDDSFGDLALAAWFTARNLQPSVRIRSNSFLGLLALAESGHGLTVLPTYLSEPRPSLQRLSPPLAELATDLWLLRHPALKDTARIKALADFLAKQLTQERLQAPKL